MRINCLSLWEDPSYVGSLPTKLRKKMEGIGYAYYAYIREDFRAIKVNTFHGVNISWYPYFVSLSLFYALLSLANYFNFGEGYIDLHLAIIFTSWFFFGWFFEWNELVLEGYVSGDQERISFTDAMILIFISETLLFASLFWAWFNTVLSCEPLGGYSWPAVGNEYPNPFTVVYFNTVILIYSGIAVTALHAMRAFNIVYNEYTYDLFILMNVAATLFSIYQEVEHMDLLMSINSVCIGCHFFFLTGLHGLHVNIGAFLLLYLFISTWFAEQEKNVGFDFEMTALYWHFVDVVWIFLFITVYWWGFF